MGIEDERQSSGLGRRSSNLELVDLHVYIVPSNSWIENRKLAQKDIIDRSISSGFVRILPSTSLSQLRKDIQEQLGSENFPDLFVFLRSVGRNFTQVKSRQEEELKVKNFLPPYAEEPEVYIKLGDYVALRSASLGSEGPIERGLPLKLIAEEEKAYTVEASTQNLSISDNIDLLSPDDEKRSRSWDSTKDNMASKSNRNHHLGPRMPKVSPRRARKHAPGNFGRSRPPTPRINEWSLGNAKKKRPSSIAPKGISQARILETPNESLDDNVADSHSLEIQTEELNINSPPPKANSSSTVSESEVKLPVPTLPNDSQRLPDVSEISKSNQVLEKQISEATEKNDTENQKNSNTTSKSGKGEIANKKSKATFSNNSSADALQPNAKNQAKRNGNTDKNKNISFSNSPASSEDSKLSLDLLKSDINGETAIVDPIKLLERAGEKFKNSKVDSRDHFDEGFHSGELVASDEENMNEPDELARTAMLSSRPDRAGTPMPRNAFYRIRKNSQENEKLSRLREKLHSEVRRRELKKESLTQKVRELQKRNASTNDQARNQWRKRFQDVKKHTPRLEDHCTMLRRELEKLVREMLVNGPTADNEAKTLGPSKKTSYEIMIMRLLQEVEDLRQRLQSVTIRLNAEIKLRSHAEAEVKKLRKDLLQKKTQVTLTRKQATFPRPQSFFISAV